MAKKLTDSESNAMIRECVQKLAGTFNKDFVSLILATVDSVDDDEYTCDVTTLDETGGKIPGVKLSTERNDGMIIFPAVGSTVMITTSTKNNYYVFMFSDVDKIQMMDGSHGGLVKVTELTDKINSLESDLNTLKAIFTAWTPVAGDGGAVLKTASATWAGQTITPTVKTDIENDKITHGS